MKRRIFAFLLTLMMCLSLLPLTVFAEQAKYRLDWKEGSRSNPNCPVTVTWEANSNIVNVSYDNTGDYFILENFDVEQETMLYKQESKGTWSLVSGVSTRILSAGNIRSGNNYGSVSIGFFNAWGTPYAFTDGVYGIDFRIGANGFHSTPTGGERFIIYVTDSNSASPVAKGEYGGHRYEIYDNIKTWKDAKAYCESRGGYLATVSSKDENDFIQNLIKQGNMYNYWLGGYKSGGGWSWVNGESFSYDNWASGEPNNLDNVEAFIHMDGGRSNKWNDLQNEGENSKSGYRLDKFGFVCEYGDVNSPKHNTMNLDDILGYYEGYFKNSLGTYTTYMTVYKEGSAYKAKYEWKIKGKDVSSLSTMTLKNDGTVFADAGVWLVSPNDGTYLISVTFTEFDGKVLYGKGENGGENRFVKVDSPKPTTTPPSGDQIGGFIGESISSGAKLWWNPVRGGVGYRVFRSTNRSDEGISATDFYITSNEFVDVNVDANKTYYYTVRQVLKEARPFEGLKEELGPVTAKVTVKTGSTILGGNASDSPAPKQFILMTLDDPYMSVNGVREEIDPGRGTTPLILNSRTMVPIRAIVEAMGGTVGWNDSTRKITLNHKNQAVVMTLNEKSITVNGSSKSIDVAPTVINARTMVPIRFAAENLGCDVDWINSTRQIVIVFRN